MFNTSHLLILALAELQFLLSRNTRYDCVARGPARAPRKLFQLSSGVPPFRCAPPRRASDAEQRSISACMPIHGVLTSGHFRRFGLLRDAQHAEHLVLEQRHQLAVLLQELRHVVVEGIVLDLVRVRVRVRG